MKLVLTLCFQADGSFLGDVLSWVGLGGGGEVSDEGSAEKTQGEEEKVVVGEFKDGEVGEEKEEVGEEKEEVGEEEERVSSEAQEEQDETNNVEPTPSDEL